MVGLDTNVIVRYLAQDDPKQSALASRFVERKLTAAHPGFISLVVLVETCWVLRSLFSVEEEELVGTLQDMLNTAQFHFERRDVVMAAIGQREVSQGRKAGFADLLIAQLAKAAGCTHMVTFDKTAARSAGMRLLTSVSE